MANCGWFRYHAKVKETNSASCRFTKNRWNHLARDHPHPNTVLQTGPR